MRNGNIHINRDLRKFKNTSFLTAFKTETTEESEGGGGYDDDDDDDDDNDEEDTRFSAGRKDEVLHPLQRRYLFEL